MTGSAPQVHGFRVEGLGSRIQDLRGQRVLKIVQTKRHGRPRKRFGQKRMLTRRAAVSWNPVQMQDNVFRASNLAAMSCLRHTSEAGGLGIVCPTLLDTADSDIACAFDSRDDRVLWPNLLGMPFPVEPDSHSKPPRFESLATPPFERIVEIPGAVLANEGDDPSRRTWCEHQGLGFRTLISKAWQG